jgi:hypothetical protein
MVSVKTATFNEEDFYVGVPNNTFLAMFDGFRSTRLRCLGHYTLPT